MDWRLAIILSLIGGVSFGTFFQCQDLNKKVDRMLQDLHTLKNEIATLVKRRNS